MLEQIKNRTFGVKVAAITALILLVPVADALARLRSNS